MTKDEAAAAVSRVLSEEILSITEAREEIHKVTGRRPSKPTVWRWIKRGSSGVHLDAVRLGGNFYTSREALTRFLVESTEAASRN